MKEKITRLKFKNGRRTKATAGPSESTYTTRWNVNEDEEMLDISVHWEPKQGGFLGEAEVNKLVDQLFITVNNTPEKISKNEEGKIKYTEEVIKKRKKAILPILLVILLKLSINSQSLFPSSNQMRTLLRFILKFLLLLLLRLPLWNSLKK